MPLGMEVGLGRDHIVLDGDRAQPPKGGQPPPQFSAHVCRDQTAACIKIPLGTVIGPGHIVLDGNPAPPLRG